MRRKKKKREFFSTYEAGKYCNVSPLSISRWIKEGKINAFTTPGNHRRILIKDLHEFMRDNGMPIPEKDDKGKIKILFVDDDYSSVESMIQSLNVGEFNFEVAAAYDGFKAGLMINQFNPDVILLNLIMPHVDGFEICRAVKNIPKTKHIKIIALTAYFDDENIKRAYECGADTVLEKPISLELLLNELAGFHLIRRISLQYKPV